MGQICSYTEAQELLKTAGISCNEFILLKSSSKSDVYRIDNRLTFRITRTAQEEEIMRLDRIKHLSLVPVLRESGSRYGSQCGSRYSSLSGPDGLLYYTAVDYLPGEELFSVCTDHTLSELEDLGRQAAGFLKNLHRISNESYDVGLYIPFLSAYKGSWQEGHRLYRDYLSQEMGKLSLKREDEKSIRSAFDYMIQNENCLSSAKGPVLLHNDFHPRNIMVREGKLSGIIDWECSLFGESDFDLIHVIHWALFPPTQTGDLKAFASQLVDEYQRENPIPDLDKRLTIYQLEHEIQQLIWDGGRSVKEKAARISTWLDGGVSLD
jgi:aminoglycoside phosphotransferase (APT) family kinase protein